MKSKQLTFTAMNDIIAALAVQIVVAIGIAAGLLYYILMYPVP